MATASFEYINPRYLLGISDEPKQLLQPISGYAREPLLPLEEACEPLITIVPRLQPHIWIAKQNSKTPSDNLTQDESAAIRLYTMEWDTSDTESRGSLYAHLNRTLKLVDRTKLRPWFRYLKLLLTALAKLPIAPRQTVWRGVRKDQSVDYPPGAESTWWAFSSCTTSLSVLESDLYLGNTGTRTLFSIEVFNGRTIRAHSHFITEDEILLLPGTYFEVRSRLNPAPDLHIVHLNQKQPPFELLEPPFEGAELMPTPETRRDTRPNTTFDHEFFKEDDRAWYKKNKIYLGIAAIIIAVIILGVVLGAVLGTRSKNPPPITTIVSISITSTPMSFTVNGSVPAPVSFADAFYAFDNNTLDLYSRRNGEVIGGPVSFIQGYVAYGQAIVLQQNVATKIQIQPDFSLTTDTSFTIEGFFMLSKIQLNAILVQLSSTITMNLTNGVLCLSLGSNITIKGNQSISTDQWHHFGFVYDAIQRIASIYIDGTIEATGTSVKPEIISDNDTSLVIVGAGFYGYIDQLSINLKAKTSAAILWDAETAAYYPLDISYTLDVGPNGINATVSNIIPIYGWLRNALNFNISDSYFQANGFTALGTPGRAFTITLWIRTEGQGGIFLTVANPYTCLLVLGLQNDATTDSNLLIAYLPNATVSGGGVSIIGPKMPQAWVHVALTWSSGNRAILYSSAYPIINGNGNDATTLTNARGGNNSSPMTVTLGHYNGTANCQGFNGINSSQHFVGSLDEVYIFGRELQQSEIQILASPPT